MINRLLTITLIISVLLFGSVEIWSSAVVQFLVFTLGLIWILKREYREYQVPVQIKLLLLTILGFICYGAFQTVPLPSSLLKLISPLSFQMQSFYSVDAKSTMPISFNVYGTVYETIRSVAFLTVFAISAASFSNRDKLIETLKTLSVFGFSLAIFAIVQHATWNRGIYWFRELTLGGVPFGPFVNRNHFAGLMGMLIPLGLGLAITQQEKEKKMLFGFMTVIMAVSLFFSLSRGGITSFFAGMALFALLMLQRNKEPRKVWIIGSFHCGRAFLCHIPWYRPGHREVLQNRCLSRRAACRMVFDLERNQGLLADRLGAWFVPQHLSPLFSFVRPGRLYMTMRITTTWSFSSKPVCSVTVFLLAFVSAHDLYSRKKPASGQKTACSGQQRSRLFSQWRCTVFSTSTFISSRICSYLRAFSAWWQDCRAWKMTRQRR